MLVTVYSIIPSILVFPGYASRTYFGFSELLWFVVLFIIAGYLRRYVDFCRINAGWLITGLFAGIVAIACYVYLCSSAIDGGAKGWMWTKWREMNSAPLLIVAICLFGLFARLKLGSVKAINAIASCMFGVYLLHDYDKIRHTSKTGSQTMKQT